MKLFKYIIGVLIIILCLMIIKWSLFQRNIKSSCVQIMSFLSQQNIVEGEVVLVDKMSFHNPFFTKGALPYEREYGIGKDAFCAFHAPNKQFISMWIRPTDNNTELKLKYATSTYYLLWVQTQGQHRDGVHPNDLEVLWPLGQ